MHNTLNKQNIIQKKPARKGLEIIHHLGYIKEKPKRMYEKSPMRDKFRRGRCYENDH